MIKLEKKKDSIKRLNFIGRTFFAWGIINFIIVLFYIIVNWFTVSTYIATDPLQKKDLFYLSSIFFFGILGIAFLISGTLIYLKTLDYQNESNNKPDIEHKDT